MKHTQNKNYTCTWLKIKVNLKCNMQKELRFKNTTKSEISRYKQKIGHSLIDRNKLFAKEFKAWCDIFNTYKPKLELFYMHSKMSKGVFREIKGILETIKKSLGIDDKAFYPKLAEFIYKYTENEGYKDILILINSEYINMEIKYDDVLFSSWEIQLDDLILKDYDTLVHMINEENVYFEKEIKKITNILDKLSDLCENQSILNHDILNSLKNYLEGHQNFIMKNMNEFN